jgi:signal peptidase II
MPTNVAVISTTNPKPVLLVRAIWFLLLATVGCAADLGSKAWVFRQDDMFRDSEWWLWEGHIGIQKSLNEGALFGMGQGKVWVFAVFSLVALLAIPVWLFYFRAARDRWLTVALGSVTGGILGNLYDRMGLSDTLWDRFNPMRRGEPAYAVRDWILWQWNEQWVWPNFNIADALLVFGAGLLMVHSMFYKPEPLTNPAHASQTTT